MNKKLFLLLIGILTVGLIVLVIFLIKHHREQTSSAKPQPKPVVNISDISKDVASTDANSNTSDSIKAFDNNINTVWVSEPLFDSNTGVMLNNNPVIIVVELKTPRSFSGIQITPSKNWKSTAPRDIAVLGATDENSTPKQLFLTQNVNWTSSDPLVFNFTDNIGLYLNYAVSIARVGTMINDPNNSQDHVEIAEIGFTTGTPTPPRTGTPTPPGTGTPTPPGTGTPTPPGTGTPTPPGTGTPTPPITPTPLMPLQPSVPDDIPKYLNGRTFLISLNSLLSDYRTTVNWYLIIDQTNYGNRPTFTLDLQRTTPPTQWLFTLNDDGKTFTISSGIYFLQVSTKTTGDKFLIVDKTLPKNDARQNFIVKAKPIDDKVYFMQFQSAYNKNYIIDVGSQLSMSDGGPSVGWALIDPSILPLPSQMINYFKRY